MKQQGYAPEVIEETIVQAAEAGLLDDRLFARLWVDDRVLYRPLSRRAVVRELRDLGVASDLIDTAMRDGYPAEREPKLAMELARARWERLRGVESLKRSNRVMAFLARRGFDAGTARGVVRTLEQEER